MKNDHRHERIGKRGVAPHPWCPRGDSKSPTSHTLFLSRPLAGEIEESEPMGVWEYMSLLKIMRINIMLLLEILGVSGSDPLPCINISFSLKSQHTHGNPTCILQYFSFPFPPASLSIHSFKYVCMYEYVCVRVYKYLQNICIYILDKEGRKECVSE